MTATNGESTASAPKDDPSAAARVVSNAMDHRRIRRHCVLLFAACGAIYLLAFAIWMGSGTTELSLRESRAAQVAADAAAIRRLRGRPQQTAEVGVPAQDLLERTGRAMKVAELDPTSLVSTLPQPARRALGSDRAEVATRLMFETVSIKPLLRFCQVLCPPNRELRVTGLQLRAATVPDRWNADVTVTYWIVAPQEAPRGVPANRRSGQ